ncbi:MAG: UvrD-helicase domain-containing protein [Chlamydiales bacterium]|nr:UvrD-helicase domain-containing protein [Chlamydiales bacterium]
MNRFDCLSPLSSLEGPCLLEASAGTGKTFAVEHIVLRLLLEKGMDIEQILVITFTRAATRELKQRIRLNLEKALDQLQSQNMEWEYLKVLADQKTAIRSLQDALGAFDRSQIFTIHGFCHRMLKEFAFEANLPISSTRSDEPRIQIPKKLQQGVRDFLSGISEDLLCPEQLHLLLKKFKGIELLVERLLRESLKAEVEETTFERLYQQYVAAWTPWDLTLSQVIDDFRLMAKNYKTQIKGRFEEQIGALLSSPSREAFRLLLAEEGSLFAFLSLQNRKVRWTPVSVLSESFFQEAARRFYPLIQEATNPKTLFATLSYAWSKSAKKLMQQEELVDPDGILQMMHEKLTNSSFVHLIQKKYAAAIIDEFQDTDALQWDIFRTLFLSQDRPVFLVGDPKQSIYRFRKADIYTYLQAKEYLPPSSHYFLDTNFRSSPPLIGALNILFEKDWLKIPKLGSFLPYKSVFAGRSSFKPLSDEKGALHVFLLESQQKRGEDLLEASICPFLVQEMRNLQKDLASLSDIAILVKDRFQANRIVSYLRQRGIAALTKTHLSLGETLGFETLYELFQALLDPKDRSKARLVLAGPLGRIEAEQMCPETPPLFFELRELLAQQGLAKFFPKLLATSIYKYTVLEAVSLEDAEFYADFFHTIELLLQWEREEGFSFEGLLHTLEYIHQSRAEEDEELRQKTLNDEAAVQVMTMHVSKGLEFDIVFAVGLGAKTPKQTEEPEEFEAEKLRQLYVAMTRAKRRLYIPGFIESASLDSTASPIELFFQHLLQEQPIEAFLQKMKAKASVTWEKIAPQTLLPESVQDVVYAVPPVPSFRYDTAPRYIHSFSSLSSSKPSSHSIHEETEAHTLHTMPAGKEIGVLFHELLEDVFSAPYPLWRIEEDIKTLVHKKMEGSKFVLWIDVVQDLLIKTLSLPFLAQLEPKDVRVEVEFLFEESPHFVKGFVDLIFRQNNQLYLVDWKSNWLGANDEAYTLDALERCMKEHDYELQASLYAKAMKRSFPSLEFGGTYYLFLRGISSKTKGIYYVV